MRILRAGVPTPNLKINVRIRGHAPVIFFAEAQRETRGECGGPELTVSSPVEKAFKECRESSSQGAGYTCMSGVGALHVDEPFGTWRSSPASSGVGEWLEITFNGPHRLTRFNYYPLDDPASWPAQISVIPDGKEQDVQVFRVDQTHTLYHLEYPITPVVATRVKFVFSEMFYPDNPTGGSFVVKGISCQKDKATRPGFRELPECVETLASFPSLQEEISVGAGFDFICPQHCLVSPKLYNDPIVVYGRRSYSVESQLCAAAIHSGACAPAEADPAPVSTHPKQGFMQFSMFSSKPVEKKEPQLVPINPEGCALKVLVRKGQEGFEGSQRHGVKSAPHGPSELAFVVKPAQLPQSKLMAPLSLMVLFSPLPAINVEGAIMDTGSIVKSQRHNRLRLSYGWARPADKALCLTPGALGDKVETPPGVLFPPDASHDACVKGTDNLSCSANSWRLMGLVPGDYTLEIELSNPCPKVPESLRQANIGLHQEDGKKRGFSSVDSTAYVQANGQSVVNGVPIAPGTTHWSSSRIRVDGELLLTSLCKGSAEECKTHAFTVITGLRLKQLSQDAPEEKSK
ncbi:MAG: hypothetical protein KVP17_003077 [Porospora cf. gigantea B]|uniref:uncharacterized protein n=1 Tax=Porospora cf. gigantea B TaxID=2853592 RepID=UPI003571A140|nr:MAG: hypothetical protein KVP17_003077 [Porospora cf. gigantea B]